MSQANSRPAELVCTTNPGLEELAFEELQQRLGENGLEGTALERLPARIKGRLRIGYPGPLPSLVQAAGTLRSVHHLLRPVDQFLLPSEAPLSAVRDRLLGVPLPEMGPATPFRVSSERRGEHPFGSQDVEREAGTVLVERFGAPVDLTGYAVEIRVDVVESLCAVTVQLTRQALSYRQDRAYRPRVSLKPNVAYACLRLARLGPGTERLLDPFCGSGTILMEAADLLPGTELWGSDWSERAVAGARANLEGAGLGDNCRLQAGDARALAALYPPASCDVLVTNPPYGARLGRGISFPHFYRDFLEQAVAVLRPGGRLVVLVRKRGVFSLAAQRAPGLRIRHVQVIETSRVFPAIFVLERSG